MWYVSYSNPALLTSYLVRFPVVQDSTEKRDAFPTRGYTNPSLPPEMGSFY